MSTIKSYVIFLGLIVVNAVPAQADTSRRLRDEFRPGSKWVVKSKMEFAKGEQAFNLIDSFFPWRRYREPGFGDSYCSFLLDRPAQEKISIYAGETYVVKSAKNQGAPGRPYISTIIELKKQ